MGDIVCPKCGEVLRGAGGSVGGGPFFHEGKHRGSLLDAPLCGACKGEGWHGCGVASQRCKACNGTGRTLASTGKAGEG